MKERHLRRSVHIHQMSAWENDDWKKQNYRLDLQSLTESCFLVEKSRRGGSGGVTPSLTPTQPPPVRDANNQLVRLSRRPLWHRAAYKENNQPRHTTLWLPPISISSSGWRRSLLSAASRHVGHFHDHTRFSLRSRSALMTNMLSPW